MHVHFCCLSALAHVNIVITHPLCVWLFYQGIVRAIKDYQDPLKEHEVTIFVRRGGPNYQEGLRVMGEVGEFVHVRIVYKKKNLRFRT